MRQGDGFNQIFVQLQITRQSPGNLCHLDAVRQARAEQIAIMVNKHLGLVFQQSKSITVDNTIPIALKGIALLGGGLLVETAPWMIGGASISSQLHGLKLRWLVLNKTG